MAQCDDNANLPSQFWSMQLNCNDSILSPWGVGACLLPFLNLIKSFPQTCVENGSLVLMGLLKHMSFSQNKTLVLPEISIFAPCTVLFVSYSSVFASHSPVVHPTPVFCIPLLLLQSCLCHTVSNWLPRPRQASNLPFFRQPVTICLFKGRHSLSENLPLVWKWGTQEMGRNKAPILIF